THDHRCEAAELDACKSLTKALQGHSTLKLPDALECTAHSRASSCLRREMGGVVERRRVTHFDQSALTKRIRSTPMATVAGIISRPALLWRRSLMIKGDTDRVSRSCVVVHLVFAHCGWRHSTYCRSYHAGRER